MIKSIKITHRNQIILVLLSLPVWYFLYVNLQNIVDFLTFTVFGMRKEAHLTEAVNFFIFETPKVFMLLILVIFGVGIIRSYFSPEKTKNFLAGKSTIFGNVMAALLGVLTPFCSCSAIPLFLGFVEAGVPLGVTFSFLIAAPLVNEIALGMLAEAFGWQTALLYTFTGLSIAIVAGWLIGALKLEKYVHDWVYEVKTGHSGIDTTKLTFSERIQSGLNSVKEIVGRIWLYIVIGVAIGAGAHGYVPEDFMANLMGKSAWYSVPLSILIGVPMYSNAAGIIPIVEVLVAKGAALGTTLAFMMSVIGLSLPEVIILKKVLKMPLILTFVSIVAIGILIVGFIFNFIY